MLIREAVPNCCSNLSDCYGLNCVPQQDTLTSQPSVPVHVTLFGHRVAADVIR